MGNDKTQRGFTIVELLIVIVVIGILAAITVVAYIGVQDRARRATVQSDLSQAVNALAVGHSNTDNYPATVDAIAKSPGTIYSYKTTSDRSAYCLSAAVGVGDVASFFVSTADRRVAAGVCPNGRWSFSGDANDVGIFGRHGIVNNATLTVDKNGRSNAAYSFNGTSSSVNLSSSLPMPMSAGTLAAWVKLQDNGGNAQNIIFYGSGGEDGCSGYPAISLATCAFTVQGSNGLVNIAMPNLIDDQWHYVVGMWDGPAGFARVYVDGALYASVTMAFTPTLTQDVGYIGRPGSNSRFAKGVIDDVAVYDRAISAKDVKALYDLGPQ